MRRRVFGRLSLERGTNGGNGGDATSCEGRCGGPFFQETDGFDGEGEGCGISGEAMDEDSLGRGLEDDATDRFNE